MATPPGWPAEVPDPLADGWEQRASSWLFDHCPPDYRGYDVLRRHPVVLAHVARASIAASVDAAESCLRTARHELREAVPQETVEAAVAAYEHERFRLREAAIAADLIWRALRGERWAARL